MTVLAAFFVLFCLAGAKPAPSRRQPAAAHRQIPALKLEDPPAIALQKNGGPGRAMIVIRNPRDEPVLLDVECGNTLTLVPIRLDARASASFNLVSLGTQCRIRSWRVWVDGKTAQTPHVRGSSVNKRRHQEARP